MNDGRVGEGGLQEAGVEVDGVEDGPGEEDHDADGREGRLLPERVGDQSRHVPFRAQIHPEDERW